MFQTIHKDKNHTTKSVRHTVTILSNSHLHCVFIILESSCKDARTLLQLVSLSDDVMDFTAPVGGGVSLKCFCRVPEPGRVCNIRSCKLIRYDILIVLSRLSITKRCTEHVPVLNMQGYCTCSCSGITLVNFEIVLHKFAEIGPVSSTLSRVHQKLLSIELRPSE